ncbi:MAG: hypothetical protein AB8B65_15685 [Kordia sp.]|uniref:hypothetical protein n=1 Tax=Kordia sp. TaxID=1965332 RepID=UPI00385D5FF9
MMKIIDRIILFIKHKNLSMRAFDKSISVGNGYTSKQSKSSASVGSDVLEKIIDVYPELSPLWLLTGKENMIINLEEAQEPPLEYNTIDALIEGKIERTVQRQLKALSKKLENIPTLDEISNEIQKKLKGDS